MREIKFRAWWTHPESDCSGFDYFDVTEGFKKADMCQELVDIQQFTGLKDKNGKEIYEGDIVDWYKKGNSYSIKYDEQTGGYEMETMSGLGHLQLHIGYGEELEVIGNIYENPELL